MAGKIAEVSTRMWKRSLLYCISITKSSEIPKLIIWVCYRQMQQVQRED